MNLPCLQGVIRTKTKTLRLWKPNRPTTTKCVITVSVMSNLHCWQLLAGELVRRSEASPLKLMPAIAPFKPKQGHSKIQDLKGVF